MYDLILDKFNHNKYLFYFSLIIAFMLLSLLAVLPFWSTGYLYSGPDMQFHLSRIQEIVDSIHQGSIHPHIATHTFNQVGDMVIGSYPWVTLYPFVFFMFLVKPVSAVYLGMAFYIFLTLLISYISMHMISSSKKISFYFAMLYGYTSFFIFNVLDFQFGTFLSYAFFPLALSGFYLIVFRNSKKWYILTLGSIGVMYSHTPSTLILLYTLAILYGATFKFQDKEKRLRNFVFLVVSAVVTLLLSLIVWVPIITMLINQNVDKPQPQMLTDGSEDFGHILFNTFSSNGWNGGIGIAIIAILIFGGVYFSKVPKFARWCYISGLITIFIISIIFPWYIIHFIPVLKTIEGIQLTERIYPIAILFLSAYGAYLINYFDHSKEKLRYLGFSCVTIIIFCGILSGVSGMYLQGKNNLKNEVELDYVATFGHQVPKNEIGLESYKVNNKEYFNQFSEENASGMTDYVPLPASGTNFGSIAFHNFNYGKRYIMLKQEDLHPSVDEITYDVSKKLKKNVVANLPFIYYKGFDYEVTVNNVKINNYYKSDRNTIAFKMPFSSNKYKINVKYIGTSFGDAYSYLSIIIWLLLIVYIFTYELHIRGEKING